MARRFFSLTLLFSTSFALSSCSWFQKDDGFPAIAPAPAAGEAAQVTPAGQTPVAPGAAGAPGTPAAGGNAFGAGGYAAPGAAAAAPPAASAPVANEQYFRHTIVTGDRLWNLARTHKTTVERIKAVNGMTTDNIILGKTITIPTTSPPPGAQLVPAPAAAAATTVPGVPATTTAPGGTISGPAATINRPAIPSALNPVVKPLPTTIPSVGPREPIAIPRPVN